jgi:protoheme IX farnesyltransferase
MYSADYAKAGIRMLPVVEPSNVSTARRIVWFSVVLIPISLLPKYFDMVGSYYVFGAVAVGLYYLYAGLRAQFDRTIPRARQVLLASVVYLPVLYGLLVLDGTRY